MFLCCMPQFPLSSNEIERHLFLFHFYEEGSKYKEFEIMYKMLNVLKGTLKITKNEINKYMENDNEISEGTCVKEYMGLR